MKYIIEKDVANIHMWEVISVNDKGMLGSTLAHLYWDSSEAITNNNVYITTDVALSKNSVDTIFKEFIKMRKADK